uniref:Choline transporter-like protein n=1 Tax=Spumella elongata TaxID=89044 RepID=A0A7S3GYN8_9STRA
MVAAVRALEFVIRQARVEAQQDGNAVCCVILLLLECVVSCLGDMLEYFSEWAYVQCAVRGVSFIEAARITYSMMTCANMQYVISDLLINSVVNLGAIFSGAVGGGVGAAAGWAIAGESAALSGAVIGGWSGLVAGSAAVGVLSSGAKTMLALWAEDPEPLRRLRPEMHEELERRITSKLED